MFQTESIEKIDESSFVMHFSEIRQRKWSESLSKKLASYNTLDNSDCKVKFQINTLAKMISIAVTIKYPKNTILNKNLDDLIKSNVKRFTDFYTNSIIIING